MGGGIEAVPGIVRAREMGLHVVCSDARRDAPGFAVAHDVIVASTYDVEGTVEAALRYAARTRPIDGVICIAADCFLTVAHVARALGLVGLAVETAELLASKLSAKELLARAGVPVPRWTGVESEDALRALARQWGLPLVVKPVDSRGARGVSRLADGVDPAWAYRHALLESPSKCVMAEEFLAGPQVSTESVVVDGRVFTVGFSDRNYEYLERFSPYIIENGGELPSFLDPHTCEEIRRVVEKAVAAVGIRNGTVKGDIVVSGGKPHVIEIAPRLSGGYFCTHEIPLNTGVDFVGAAILLALGEAPRSEDLEPKYERAVAQRYLFADPGRVEKVCGVEQAARLPGIELCEVRVRPGDIVPPIRSHPARAGVVIATGGDRLEAVERASSAIATLRIVTSAMS